MKVKIRNIGSSQGVIIPKPFLTELGMPDSIDISMEHGKIIITPLHQKPVLKELLKDYQSDHQVDWGEAEGEEIW